MGGRRGSLIKSSCVIKSCPSYTLRVDLHKHCPKTSMHSLEALNSLQHRIPNANTHTNTTNMQDSLVLQTDFRSLTFCSYRKQQDVPWRTTFPVLMAKDFLEWEVCCSWRERLYLVQPPACSSAKPKCSQAANTSINHRRRSLLRSRPLKKCLELNLRKTSNYKLEICENISLYHTCSSSKVRTSIHICHRQYCMQS